MSWLARSLVNSLRPDPADPTDSADSADPQQPESPTRGVKDDLSELSQTLSRHFRGFSSFLAPPPVPPPPDSAAAAAAADSAAAAAGEDKGFAAMRSDLAEIGGRVRSGISMLSGNKAVSEISKIASTIFGSEEGDEEEGEGGEVGVTEEVVGFVGNVSMHPETWLDFPLLAEFDDDSDDFYLSDAQQEHALAVERLVPRLAALRIELCPSHMNEDCFWKIYFVLLHPRLSKQDAELLSTPQIVQARAMLLHDLQTRTRMDTQDVGIDPSLHREERATLDASGDDVKSPSIIPDETTPLNAQPAKLNTSGPSTEIETDKHPIETTEVRIVEKSVIEEEPTTQVMDKSISVVASKAYTQSYEEDGDEWLEEETGETSLSGRSPVLLGDEEDVSFSDLEVEADDDEELHVSSRIKRDSADSSTKIEQNKDSDGAVRSGGSSPPTRGSNDWLDVDIDTV